MAQWPDWEVLLGDGDAAVSAPVLQMDATRVVFEWYRPEPPLRLSQVVNPLRLRRAGVECFAGRGVVTGLLTLDSREACIVRWDEPGPEPGHLTGGEKDAAARYEAFLSGWQAWQLLPERLKLTSLDLHSYLTALRAALAPEEIRLAALPPRERPAAEMELLQMWAPCVLAAVDKYHEDFEAVVAAHKTPGEVVEVLVRRLLSPLFLPAPFGHRTFYKPLGYAGDYEMMGMIMRNSFEGETLYAKLVHYWLVQQWAARSVRNRIAHLGVRLREESARAFAAGRKFRVLNVGCGPAWEVRQFIATSARADDAEFTLVDFEANAIQHAAEQAARACHVAGRHTSVRTVQMSVMQLIKESLRAGGAPLGRDFDLVYCVGLFDYLPAQTCRQLTTMFYNWTRAGGLVAVANMMHNKPYRHMVEYLLDWHLIYRPAAELERFVPTGVPREQWRVVGEEVAVNLFLEVRKPA